MPEQSRDEQLRAEALLRSQISGGQAEPEQLSLFGDPKIRDEQLKTEEAISRAINDQTTYLDQQTSIRERHLKIEQQLADLQKAHADELERIKDLGDKDMARTLKQVGLQKDLVDQIKKGKAVPGQAVAVVEKSKDLAAIAAVLKARGLSIEEGQAAGLLNATDAAKLSKGPAGFGGLFKNAVAGGHMSHHGAFAALLPLLDNPIVATALLGLSVAHGIGNMESEGAAGVFQNIPIIGGTLAGIFNEIPGFKALTAFGNTTRLGMVTGDGYGAGLSAQFRAFKMGANPFDILSNQTATEIIAAARNQGFRGAQERAYEGSMVDIYKQTGLAPDQMAQMGEIFARNNGLTQFRDTMTQIDNIARNSSQSVANVASQIQSLSESLAGTGAAPLGLAGAIVQAVSVTAPHLTAEQQQSVAQFFGGTESLARFSGFQGAAATTAIGRRVALQNQRYFLQSWRQQMAGLPQDQQDLMLANLVNAGFFSSVKAARQTILQGNQIIGRIPYTMSLRAFSGASDAFRAFGDTHHVNQGGRFAIQTPGGMSENAFNFGSRRAYLNYLTTHLHSGNLTAAQIANVTAPLRAAIHDGDWHKAAVESQNRMKQYTIQNNKAATRNTVQISLTPEARRFFSAKNIQSRIQLENARQGSATYQGTDRSGG